MKRVLLPVAILVGCFLVAALLIRNPPQLEESSPEIIPVAVRVIEVQQESVQLTVESQGKVQAAQTANVSAAVAGPVAWISPAMEAGGHVMEGEVLLRLEASDFETALFRSEAALQQAEAEASHSLNELSRLRELAEQRLASDSQLQDSIRTAAVNEARLADAQASFGQAELDLARTEIKAPFNAIIESRDVELGQYVNRAQSVGVLFGADVVEVRLPLALRQVGFLDIPLGGRGELLGDLAPEVKITGFFGGEEHIWQGKLVRTEATIDANSNTVQTIIRVEQPDGSTTIRDGYETIPLPVGLYVKAEIIGREVDGLISLPRSVIRNNNQVLVVDAENKMYYREIEIFRLEEQQVLISGGILPGERICTSPIQAVVDGMSVQPIVEYI
ncbi:MAG: efflux RND transporter periplasmic adaptor subunit [Gammaproteobacteria bacterium]|jgi:RND family efflux transporter MFP subunit|nr:efflux RND transporter periplasmic adaptor subunit [Gammaproteobacteria bacterium]MBT3859021.1 efflux RND transporter periplasmic adaptor subunit [Gammaproteobacteria bacterium]MBT3987868.1 efflux RND transporter periplasmic adaptor subunit [Gammaproteobacteria bacterium]MBT4257532.1 efflux RND transporter periplasmic adaptor subunit [Gammaproteobacteria bacterium]MBT4583306.1 efflux RND transporter periplasmic adaptor subunit [Gammaproteobacteria bacterium]